MEQVIVDYIQKVARKTEEIPTMNLFGPWNQQVDDSQRKFISSELDKVGIRTIRLSEHADLYTRKDLNLEDIERYRKAANAEYEQELRVWEFAVAAADERTQEICAIIFDSPVPPSGYTVVQEDEE